MEYDLMIVIIQLDMHIIMNLINSLNYIFLHQMIINRNIIFFSINLKFIITN